MEVSFLPLSVPNLSGRELEYVTKAVETGWVSTAGSYVSDFETAVASYAGTPGATACQNGTAGLHIALLICGVKSGDLVLVPTLTFIAAVNPVRYLGAAPVFLDCDSSLCIDPVKLEQFCREECELRDNILYHRDTGRRVPAIVIVHVFGNLADMEAITRIAKTYHLKVIEDATEAIGSKYTAGPLAGRHAGTIGDIGVYSFNGNKIITTGGGGMIVSQDAELLRRAKHLTTQAKSDEEKFYHDEIGYNYRMTNLQAALGLAQLEQLETFITTKIRNYQRYRNAVEQIPGLSFLPFREGTRSNHWFYALVCEPPYPFGPLELMERLRAEKIQTRPVWGLIHEQKPYTGSLAYQPERAKYYWEHILNLPCSAGLTEADVDRVAAALRRG